ncbi:MAG TPA: PAAR domain-containing protein [Roseateles sp.]
MRNAKNPERSLSEGSAIASINGTPVAVEGCKTECGSTLIAVQTDMTFE